MTYIKATPEQADAQQKVVAAAHKAVEKELDRLRDAVAACRKGKGDVAAHMINHTLDNLQGMLCQIDSAPVLSANPRHFD